MLSHKGRSASSRWSDAKQSVLTSTDIVELIGQTVALKQQGKDFVGLCPFHDERTPSFHVSPAKRFFHCFGCSANGNAIDFVMKRDRISFVDALRSLGGGRAARQIISKPTPTPAVAKKTRAVDPSFGNLAIAYDHTINDELHYITPTAAKLGLEIDSLLRLRIGWAGKRFCFKCFEQGRAQADSTAWAFPMSDVAGQVRGIRLRFVECGHKTTITGGQEGLFIPRGIENVLRIFVCEGPTDTAAMLDMGFATIGRPSCRGGVDLLCAYLKARAIHELTIVADGDGPGRGGAEAFALRARLFCQRVKIITPPDGTKDARQWKQQGATAADVERIVAAAPLVNLTIKSQLSKKSLLEGASK